MYGNVVKRFNSFTCSCTRLFDNGMNHAFAFPAETGPHFQTPKWWKADLVSLHAEIVYPPKYPFKY